MAGSPVLTRPEADTRPASSACPTPVPTPGTLPGKVLETDRVVYDVVITIRFHVCSDLLQLGAVGPPGHPAPSDPMWSVT